MARSLPESKNSLAYQLDLFKLRMSSWTEDRGDQEISSASFGELMMLAAEIMDQRAATPEDLRTQAYVLSCLIDRDGDLVHQMAYRLCENVLSLSAAKRERQDVTRGISRSV